MRLPQITHLQFLVLSSLMGADRSGREVREMLKRSGQRTSVVAFYRLMARMEDAGLVEGRYVRRSAGGVGARERWYRLLSTGRRECKQTLDFYSSVGRICDEPELVEA